MWNWANSLLPWTSSRFFFFSQQETIETLYFLCFMTASYFLLLQFSWFFSLGGGGGFRQPGLNFLDWKSPVHAKHLCMGVLCKVQEKNNLLLFLSVSNIRCYRGDGSCVFLPTESIILSEIRLWLSFRATSAFCYCIWCNMDNLLYLI